MSDRTRNVARRAGTAEDRSERCAELLSGTVPEEALTALRRWNLSHYIEAGVPVTLERLHRLHQVVIECIRARHLDSILAYTDRIAEERYLESFSLVEIQTAFNVLEEALWNRIIAECEPGMIPEFLGLVSTVVGAGRDRLAQRYVELICRQSARKPEYRALSVGTQGGTEAGCI